MTNKLQEDLGARDRAMLPHFIKIGKLLREARAQLPADQFDAWVSQHFQWLSVEQAKRCIALSEQVDALVRNGEAR